MARPSLRLRQGVDFNLQSFTVHNNNHIWRGTVPDPDNPGQRLGTSISYGIGDIVIHNNQLWVSTTAGNDDSEPANGNDDWDLITPMSGNVPDLSHFFDGIVPMSVDDRIELVGTDTRQNSRDGLTLILQNGIYNLRARVQNNDDPGFEPDVTSVAVGTHVYVNRINATPSLPSTNLENIATVTHNYSFNGSQFLDFSPSRDTIAFLNDLVTSGVNGAVRHTVENGSISQFSSDIVRIDRFIPQTGVIPVGYDPVGHRLVNAPEVRSGPEFTILSLNNANSAFTNFPTDPMIGDRLYNPHISTIVRELQEARTQEFGLFTAREPVSGLTTEPFFSTRGSIPGQAADNLSDHYFLMYFSSQAGSTNNGNAVRVSELERSLRVVFPNETISGQADVERILNNRVIRIGDTGGTQFNVQLATPFHTNPAGAEADGFDGYGNLPSSGPGGNGNAGDGSVRFYVRTTPDGNRNARAGTGGRGALAGFPSGIHQTRIETVIPQSAITQNVRNQTFYTFIGLDHISGGLADNAGWRREAFDDGIGR